MGGENYTKNIMYLWIEIAQLIKGPYHKSWRFLESAGQADSPGHLTFNCGVHIIVAIQRKVKRDFFPKNLTICFSKLPPLYEHHS